MNNVHIFDLNKEEIYVSDFVIDTNGTTRKILSIVGNKDVGFLVELSNSNSLYVPHFLKKTMKENLKQYSVQIKIKKYTLTGKPVYSAIMNKVEMEENKNILNVKKDCINQIKDAARLLGMYIHDDQISFRLPQLVK